MTQRWGKPANDFSSSLRGGGKNWPLISTDLNKDNCRCHGNICCLVTDNDTCSIRSVRWPFIINSVIFFQEDSFSVMQVAVWIFVSCLNLPRKSCDLAINWILSDLYIEKPDGQVILQHLFKAIRNRAYPRTIKWSFKVNLFVWNFYSCRLAETIKQLWFL